MHDGASDIRPEINNDGIFAYRSGRQVIQPGKCIEDHWDVAAVDATLEPVGSSDREDDDLGARRERTLKKRELRRKGLAEYQLYLRKRCLSGDSGPPRQKSPHDSRIVNCGPACVRQALAAERPFPPRESPQKRFLIR